MKLSKTIAALLICAAATSATIAADESQRFTGDISLLIANDLGRNGYYDQKAVAATMGTVAEEIGPEAVLALGDTHHYGGVQSVSDPLWLTNFETIYDHPELMVDWRPVCGNHEYRGNTQAVIDYSGVSRRWKMPARYYTDTFEDHGTSIRVILLDTTPLIEKYHAKSDTYPDVQSQDTEAQLQWLEKTLESATEQWIVVAGHHPIYAFTDKDESERTDMQKRVDTILRRHKVDMYICGHLHNYQHIRKPGSDIDYIVNTSGSQTRTPEKTDGTVFCSDAAGFSVLTADKNALRLYMLDKAGCIVHTVVRRQ